MKHFLLAGNPNCGKTTLFNALTGDNQRIGNWPGVTVEKKSGAMQLENQTAELTDLPGIYSLATEAGSVSQDEHIAAQAVIDLSFDCIINVIDASHLERHLYLTSQLLELNKPVIVALNMMDIAQQRGISINVHALEQLLGCPVIPLQAHKNKGVDALRHQLLALPAVTQPLRLSLPEATQEILSWLTQQLINQGVNETLACYYSRRLAEGAQAIAPIEWTAEPGLDVILADARYQTIHAIVRDVQKKNSDASEHLTARLDRIVLHRFFALPIFFAVMYTMFLFAINIGGAFQDFFDIGTDTVFVQGSAWLLQQIQAPAWLIALIANGIGKGINTTLTFIPVIASMFFFLSLLETSGYMARAAFVVDKAMRAMGLPGKSFVPMIVGFGCNVPAIMAARTLDSERDRLLTVMMSPFMSCSARLAIYAVFVAAFFPEGGHNIVFSLYVMGIVMAVFTGWMLRKTLLKGQASPLILELPAYHKPALKRVCKETMLRLRFFILRAGKWIIPVCVLLGGLNAITVSGSFSSGDASAESVLSLLGQWITPLFSPMGIYQDNWQATVGLLTGMLAKEVVVGSLNSLYAQASHAGEIAAAHFDFFAGMKAAFWSIPENLSQLGSALWNPVLASADDSTLSQSAYGVMSQRFDGKIGAYAYLLFILLYIPCVSTIAVIRQEANRHFMWLSIIWSFVVAYASAVLFYQTANYLQHPQASTFWIGSMIGSVMLVIALFHLSARYSQRRLHVITNP